MYNNSHHFRAFSFLLSELPISNIKPESKKEDPNDSVEFIDSVEKEEPKNVGNLLHKVHNPKDSVLDLVNQNRYDEAMYTIMKKSKSKRQEDKNEAIRQCQQIQDSLHFELQDEVDYSSAQLCPYSPSVLQGCCPGFLEEFVPLKSRANGNCLYSSVCTALQVRLLKSRLHVKKHFSSVFS